MNRKFWGVVSIFAVLALGFLMASTAHAEAATLAPAEFELSQNSTALTAATEPERETLSQSTTAETILAQNYPNPFN